MEADIYIVTNNINWRYIMSNTYTYAVLVSLMPYGKSCAIDMIQTGTAVLVEKAYKPNSSRRDYDNDIYETVYPLVKTDEQLQDESEKYYW